MMMYPMSASTPIPHSEGTSLAMSMAVSVITHAVVLVILTFVVIQVSGPKPSSLRAGDREVYLTLATSNPEQWQAAVPWTAPKPQVEVIPSTVAPGPQVDQPLPTTDFNPTTAVSTGHSGGTIVSGTTPSMSLTHAGNTITFGGLSQGGRQASSVVYVVDASGPMISSLPQVFAEVERSVAGLSAGQSFNVVLFRDNNRTRSEEFRPELVRASASARAELSSWLRQMQASASGKSNPLDGLRRAIAMQPQVVFLLSRSIPRNNGNQWGEGMRATMDELERLNPIEPSTGERAVVIKTLQFLEPDTTGIMKQIAASHGSGNLASDHRVLTREELGMAGGTGKATSGVGVNLPDGTRKPGAR
jgi:hypothetical protein